MPGHAPLRLRAGAAAATHRPWLGDEAELHRPRAAPGDRQVISNLLTALTAVCDAARRAAVEVCGVQKANAADSRPDEHTSSRPASLAAGNGLTVGAHAPAAVHVLVIAEQDR